MNTVEMAMKETLDDACLHRPTAALLAMGGDERLDILLPSQRNRYGCAFQPDPDLLAFGSSTATSISGAGFEAAKQLHDELLAQRTSGLPAQLIYADQLQRMRNELASACSLRRESAPEIIFAASGTDLHLIATQLCVNEASIPLRIIIAGADETGSGVPMAVAGRHFADRSALGQSVTRNSPLGHGPHPEFASIPIRDIEGAPRASQDIDADVTRAVQDAMQAGRRVLLIVLDLSKTGMIAPSPHHAFALRDAHPNKIDILVDACQFRLAPPTLNAYLERGAMVALTGSKFVTGPSFCGMLLLPSATADKYRLRTLPVCLAAYTPRADWPQDWPGADGLPRAANFGLLLRWEAALTELRMFNAIPCEKVTGLVQRLSAAIRQQLSALPFIRPLPVPPIDRGLQAGSHWDGVQTIFPFVLTRSDAGGKRIALSSEATTDIHQALQNPSNVIRCQFGQPVRCGATGGAKTSALRLSISARHVCEAAASGEAAIIKKITIALEQLELALDRSEPASLLPA